MKKILFILILFCSFQGFGQIKGYFRLNGNSNDASGNGYNGTATSITYSQSNGRLNSGAGFNGSSSRILLSSSLRRTGVFTISVWIKPSVLPSGDGQYITSDWSFSGRNYLCETIGTQIRMVVGNGSQSQDADLFGGTLSTDKWYNIVFVRNGTSHKIYLDGVEVASQTGSYSGGTTSNNLYIGCDSALGTFFTGAIDEVIISNLAWSPAKIKNYYLSTSFKFSF